MGESTQRSELDAEHLTAVLRQQGVANLAQSQGLVLVLDGMELRREGASAQEHLMRVKALNGQLVNGYRSFNVLGIGEGGARGLLYHHLFSSEQPGFRSENDEIVRALAATEAALAEFAGEKTWVLDRGFDNDALWWWVWEQTRSQLVWRVKHRERVVQWQTPAGVWEERYLEATLAHLRPLATLQTELVVRLPGQRQPKRQPVTVEVAAVPVRLYAPKAKGNKQPRRTKDAWCVQVKVHHALDEPWLLLTDWPVSDAESALRIFALYRQRWAVEDSFKFIKQAFGLEEVQMLKLEAVRTLVALAWVAAGFLFQLGLTLDLPEVRLLARLGGWEERSNRPPGKLVLTRGLRRLLDLLATEAILHDHQTQHGDLPPFVKRILARH
jgi:hypothetical protein